MLEKRKIAEDIARMATRGEVPKDLTTTIEEALRRVALDEREACAQVAEALSRNFHAGGLARAADEITRAIRRRGAPTPNRIIANGK